jgi:CYTH domain-containing protein
MAEEIERKFLPGEVPEAAESCDPMRIEQGYLAVEKEAEVRLRRLGEETVLTAKGGSGEVREEVEIPLREEHFEELWPLTEGRRLRKVRYLIPIAEGLEVELDVFEGELEGLVIAEVEFPDERRAAEFDPPAWLGGEVTGDGRYAGQSLALEGAP